MPEFIFTMQDVSRVHPPDKRVLENITLAFFYGAKIGVIGGNGSGKSSLIRIMAGVDKDFLGEAHAAAGIKIGYFAQEPELGDAETVRESVEQAVSDIRGLVTEFEELSMKLGEPMSDDAMTKLLEKQAALQDKIDVIDAWNLDSRVDIAMEALRVPPGDAKVKDLSGGERRRVALCRILLSRPDMLLLDEPTNHL
ncbi:MAG TPA: ATP-binding cassette domain-containing protein, partial [Polyangiaceae bacterium]|nr:ATP-binding cassette domain-containing protein [Polyangiaceae bacterium]